MWGINTRRRLNNISCTDYVVMELNKDKTTVIVAHRIHLNQILKAEEKAGSEVYHYYGTGSAFVECNPNKKDRAFDDMSLYTFV